MSEGSKRTKYRWLAVALAIVGATSVLWGLFGARYACFMVTDAACRAEAEARFLPFELLGIALIVAAIVVAIWAGVRRRGDGDPDTRQGR